MAVRTPEWVKSAVFYQIFPDRFRKSSNQQPLSNLFQKNMTWKSWGSSPEEQGYQGGDLYGIAEKLDYLNELGVTALYLNPIFSSASNHRYHTYDFLQVDPLLGGNDALRVLLDSAHDKGIKVVLDGVFNHASRGFWPFHHILENGADSPYIDWFHIDGYPLNPYPQKEGDVLNYKSWWNLPALPKFNTDNQAVREYLFHVAEYWIEFGIDGWRLDVPNEIDDDSFWQEFRQRVKAKNPDAYICGEIWGKADRWLQGDQFDAVMNYPIGTAALSYFGADHLKSDYQHEELNLSSCDANEFCQRIEENQSWYDWEINQVQLNLLDSHDMPRAKWLVQDDANSVKIALAFILSMPGAPCIYYGTEIGLNGGPDPGCREAFPWQSPEKWDLTISDVVRKHATARKKYPVLAKGSLKIKAFNKDVIIVERNLLDQSAQIVFNRSDTEIKLPLDFGNKKLTKLDGNAEKSKNMQISEINLKAFSVELFVS